MAAEIGENTKLQMNIKTILGICFGLMSLCGVYFTLIAEIQSLQVRLMRIEEYVKMNSEFRVKWPRGELGSLPDDAEQNMRLQYLEKHQEKALDNIQRIKLKVKEIELKK